jgi:succinyl-diaminopimelate desuccinylase
MNKLNPVKITSDLIKRQSVTPKDDGAIELIRQLLLDAGFKCKIIKRNGIINLFARWGLAENGLTFCFNGHTDVVPPGPLDSWTNDPFSAFEENGLLFGRGSTDMKSAIGAFISAAVNYISENKPNGSIVIAITGDEEGEAKDGTVAILDWMKENNEKIDHCLVGEPTSQESLGDTIKIGRRGSLTAKFTALGLQGHVAYPEKAVNPLPPLTKLLLKLQEKPLDKGNEFFDPSSFAITSIDTGNPSTNVIPEKGEATVNIRFNDLHSDISLTNWLKKNIAEATDKTSVRIELDLKISARPFICKPGDFAQLISKSVQAQTKIFPSISTSGGTSDARFIQEYCPVVEFGLVGKTMHKTDEHVEIKQIMDLSTIYYKILKSYFSMLEVKN